MQQKQRVGNSGVRPSNKRKDIPDGLWVKCSECGEIIYNGELSRNLKTCPKCDYYFPLQPAERIASLVDKGSFIKCDPAGAAVYNREGNPELVAMTGEAKLSGHRLVIGAINLGLMRSGLESDSIALFVCEKIIRAIARATDQQLPLLLICADSNESQLQNDVFFSGQTLSTSAAMSRLNIEKLLYISVIAHSHSHGHFPGFAYLADIAIAESNVPVTSRTSNRGNQNGAAQAAQSSFQNGMVDMIVPRAELKQTLTNILNFFC